MSTIGARSASVSARNRTMSSMRLTNSGLKRSIGSPGQVRRHDQHDVGEVDRAALAVGEPAVVEQLQQDVEHVGVGLLDLVEQHHRVGPAPDGLGELAALVVADVARGRADEPADRVLLHVLATCRCGPSPARRRRGSRPACGPARSCRRRWGRGTGTSRSAGAGRTGRPATAADGVGHRGDRLVLADRPARGAPPPGGRASASRPPSAGTTGTPVHLATTSATSSSSTSSFSICCAGLELGERGGGLLDLPLELGDPAVADLGGLLEVGLALELGAQVLELLLEARMRPMASFSSCQWAIMRVALLGEVGQLLVEGVEPLLATRRRSPWPARPARSRAGGRGARRRRSRWASSRSRCAAWTAASSTRSMALSGRKRPVR